jgi:hypothetical protein
MANLTPPSVNTFTIPPAVVNAPNFQPVAQPAIIGAPMVQPSVSSAGLNFGLTNPTATQIPSGVNHEFTTRQPITFRTEQPGVLEHKTTTKVIQPSSMVPVTQVKPAPSDNYWNTPDVCHPGRQPYKCPIGIYVFLVVLLIVINIWAIFRAPRIDNHGRTISTSTIWWAAIIGIAFMLIFSGLFAYWIFQQCRSCDGQSHHIVFTLAIGVPIILGIITGLVIGGVMNIGFLWTASREPNPESSNINC